MEIGEAIHIMDVRRNDGTMLFSQRTAWDVIRPLVAPAQQATNMPSDAIAASERLCEIYFTIAAECVGESEVRRRVAAATARIG